jgi:hypothetical protein
MRNIIPPNSSIYDTNDETAEKTSLPIGKDRTAMGDDETKKEAETSVRHRDE